jgi:hypothetical protein
MLAIRTQRIAIFSIVRLRQNILPTRWHMSKIPTFVSIADTVIIDLNQFRMTFVISTARETRGPSGTSLVIDPKTAKAVPPRRATNAARPGRRGD